MRVNRIKVMLPTVITHPELATLFILIKLKTFIYLPKKKKETYNRQLQKLKCNKLTNLRISTTINQHKDKKQQQTIIILCFKE